MYNNAIIEGGSYTCNSDQIKIHPYLPLMVRTINLDLEVKDLATTQPPTQIRFPFQATSWII
jgi:hypothetical protein